MIPRTLLLLAFLALTVQSGCMTPEPGYDELMESGVADYEAGEYTDALAMFRAAAGKDRERPEPSYYQGLCYLGLADKGFRHDNLPHALRYCDRAASMFDAAVDAFPGYAPAVQGQADALRLKGRHSAALAITNWAAKQSGPRAKMLRQKAQQYAQSGDMDKALLTYVQATSVEPDNAAAHAELGLFYLRCGNEADAVNSLKRAWQLDPGAPGVVEALTQLGAWVEEPPAMRGNSASTPRTATTASGT